MLTYEYNVHDKIYKGKDIFYFNLFNFKDEVYLILSTDSVNLEIIKIESSETNIKLTTCKFLRLKKSIINECNYNNFRFLEVSSNYLYVVPAQK